MMSIKSKIYLNKDRYINVYELIKEHPDFIVVDKFPGISIHNENNQGLIERLRGDFQTKAIYPVHRLDKPTSGLLLCARSEKSASILSQLFQHRAVEKYYLALSHQKPKKKQGLLIGDMERTRNGNWKLLKTQKNPAITQFFSYGVGDDGCARRLFLLKPYTGKTHQLRVALKSIGSPICGDQRYGSASDKGWDRTYLHSYHLCFSYEKKRYQYQCLPKGDAITDKILTFISEKLDDPAQLLWPALPEKILSKKIIAL